MSSVLVGLFDSKSEAEAARAQLLTAGFMPAAVSVSSGSADVGSTGLGADQSVKADPMHEEGTISHFFSKLFGGDDDTDLERNRYSEHYGEAFKRGAYSVTVTTDNEAETDRAEEALNAAGAIDIDERVQQWRNEGWQGSTTASGSGSSLAAAVPSTTTDRLTTGDTGDTGARQTLQEVEEELKVGKRAVSRGGVRVFSRLTEVPVEESVRLREETADVQRRAVDRPATEADFAAFKEGSVEIRNTAEEAVVSKTARVVGEVEVGKRVTERDEVVRDTVRKTQVEVEQLDGGRETAMQGTGTDSLAAGTSGGSMRPGSANADPLTGESGAHPVGTALGAAAGGVAAGAAVGTMAGPVGTVIGAAVGAVGGGLAGKGVAEEVDPTLNDGTTKPR